jgi:hypothetical protein
MTRVSSSVVRGGDPPADTFIGTTLLGLLYKPVWAVLKYKF